MALFEDPSSKNKMNLQLLEVQIYLRVILF